MNTIYTDQNGKVRIGDIDIFLEIAIDCYCTIKKLNIELNDLLAHSTKFSILTEGGLMEIEWPDDSERIFIIQQEEYKNEINGIISLSTFYEAFINEIGITELGSKYYKDNLDRNSILAKWEIVLKLVYGESISTDLVFYKTMKDVIATRNKLAHYKTRETSDDNRFTDFSTIFCNGVEYLEELLIQLRRMDIDKNIIPFNKFESSINRIK